MCDCIELGGRLHRDVVSRAAEAPGRETVQSCQATDWGESGWWRMSDVLFMYLNFFFVVFYLNVCFCF